MRDDSLCKCGGKLIYKDTVYFLQSKNPWYYVYECAECGERYVAGRRLDIYPDPEMMGADAK